MGVPHVAEPAYRDEVLQVEPKGIEHVRDSERHGQPHSVFTLWIGANVEMATVVTGSLGVVLWGLSFWQAAIAFVIGTVLGAALLGLLSLAGPRFGVPQLVGSRRAFGFFGNFAPGILNIIAGIGWYAVNSVLGAFALSYLLHLPYLLATLIMVVIQGLVAVYGHNMIHSLERYLSIVLVLVFLAVTVYTVGHMNTGLAYDAKAPLAFGGVSGGFLATVGVSFAYMAGWMAFASDYTRYLPRTTRPGRIFGAAFGGNVIGVLWPGLLGVALASMAPQVVGNGAATVTGPVAMVTSLLPHVLATILLIAVVIGTITANVLNIYSAALSTLVVNLPVQRWVAAVGIGVLGGLLTVLGQANFAGNLQNFLFLLAYWVAPWAGIVAIDAFLVHRGDGSHAIFYSRAHRFGWGFVAWLLGIAAAVPFFNQTYYQGPFALSHPQFGDLSYWVSLVVASGFYLFFEWVSGRRRAEAPKESAHAHVVGAGGES